jgi:plastocyanin
VTIENIAFSPSSITVPVGTTVTWTNKDSFSHTVTSDTGLFDSGEMSQGSTFSHTFNDKGTFSYHCTIHTTMHGTVTVQ